MDAELRGPPRALVAGRMLAAGLGAAARLRSAWSRRVVRILALPSALLLLLGTALIHHIYLDRSGLPDLEAFLRFEPPRIGAIHDDRGEVLIELAHEYRRVVSYHEVPLILREAILAAEDRNFFSHSGVEYRALPRVARMTATHSLAAWWRGEGTQPRFPQGGSTLTQQLVRNYFLQDLIRRENGDTLIQDGLTPHVVSAVIGVRATNKLLRKVEEIRLTLWLEQEMRRRFRSWKLSKRELFGRYVSFVYMGNGRYGFAAASEYYFGRPLSSYTEEDAGQAALLAGITRSPGAYAPVPGDATPMRRRNAILALMARNGSIPVGLAQRCQAEPVRVVPRNPIKTSAPGAIASVLRELKRCGGSRFGIEDLFQGRIAVRSTIDGLAQAIVNEELEQGLARYEQRHHQAKGLIQGSVVVLHNSDAAILAEAGGRRLFKERSTRYSDLNRVTGSLRQPGSAWKPLVYLAAFGQGLELDTAVPDAPIDVPLVTDRGVKWIANYDHQFKGLIPVRQALAESRNAVAVWVARAIGVDEVNRTARQLGIRTPLLRYISTALGASEVRLLELAGAYRAMASGMMAQPHVIARVTDASTGVVLYSASMNAPVVAQDGPDFAALRLIQEGLRGVVRLPEGTAHALDGPDFPIPVMGKTGTTSDYRDALFVGSTYGPHGITVAVRLGFDDNRTLGARETGSRAVLPIFRAIMLRLYGDRLVGPVPQFPADIEAGIDRYLAALQADPEAEPEGAQPAPDNPRATLATASVPVGGAVGEALTAIAEND